MKYLMLVILFFITSCVGSSPEFSNYHRVAGFANKQIRKEIPVTDDGPGAMIPEKIHAYSTIFHIHAPISIELARFYTLRMVEIVLENFNADPAIQEYLEVRPFTSKNVSISIFSDSWGEYQAPESYTDFISFSFGKLSYHRYNRETDKFELLFSETYEEALAKCPSFKQSTKQ